MAESESGEQTEDPTQKRLDEALERGDVVKSQEVNTWFIIAGATLLLASFSGSMGSGISTALRGLIANSYQLPADGRGLIDVVRRIGGEMLTVVGVPLLLLVVAAIAGNVIQHRLVFSADGLKPKFSKVSPAAGAKRLFSKQSLVNFVKGIVKLVILGWVMTALLWPERFRLVGLVQTDILGSLELTKSLSVDVLGHVVAILALIAAADYFFQYRQWFERQKMSLQQVKEEFKQTEGDPVIKGKIRQLRQNRARRRMMAQVPNASVIITNPTHYAVALQYERGMAAPLCLAKGMDGIALKIREIAAQHSIPIVENPPLARALHATVDVDQEIPAEHYKAVAEVIGYVMKLRGSRGAART
jgi:flagellar biosynthetic protein FlhB